MRNKDWLTRNSNNKFLTSFPINRVKAIVIRRHESQRSSRALKTIQNNHNSSVDQNTLLKAKSRLLMTRKSESTSRSGKRKMWNKNMLWIRPFTAMMHPRKNPQ